MNLLIYVRNFCLNAALKVAVHGLVVARLRVADKNLCFPRKPLRYAALGTGCTLTVVPRSTQPSTLRGTVNEYQAYG